MGKFSHTFIIEDVSTHQVHSLHSCRTSLFYAYHADTCAAQHEELLSPRVDYTLHVSPRSIRRRQAKKSYMGVD